MGEIYTKCAYVVESVYGEDSDTSVVAVVEYKRGSHDDVYVLTTDNEVVLYEFLDEEDYDEYKETVLATVPSVSEFMDVVERHR